MMVELRPQEGGEDAARFAEELSEVLLKRAKRLGLSARVEESDARTVVVRASGPREDELRELVGTHRVQRAGAGDKGRRHTSSVSVVVLEDAASVSVVVRDEDLVIDRYRGSGKGGQHRNKVSTAVRVRHVPSGVVVALERGRSQHQNLVWAKEEVQRRLDAAAAERARGALEERRRRQLSDVTTFTHNDQRGEVIDHARGRRWDARAFSRGLA